MANETDSPATAPVSTEAATTTLPQPNPIPSPPTGSANPDDLGLDRAFVMTLARIPVIALLWLAAAWFGSLLVSQNGWLLTVYTVDGAITANIAPLVVICLGMLLAAFIDGYAFKVPNWVTLSLVISGWYIGFLHTVGENTIPGAGGIVAAITGTILGFVFLFPALFIGGMGEGDVKMTMGFGSWLFAYFGIEAGAWVLFWSFSIGVIVGGIFGLVIILLRGQVYKNITNAKEIMVDLQVLATAGPKAAQQRAQARRPNWWRLPYGVPLCVGFLGYLWYLFFVANR